MIIKPLNRPTTSQTSTSILSWMLAKARVSEEGARRRFRGQLSNHAVGELVQVIKELPRVTRAEVAGEGGTIYHYSFMMVRTLKGKFNISIRRPHGRQVGDTYSVELDYRAVSLEELLGLYERGN